MTPTSADQVIFGYVCFRAFKRDIIRSKHLKIGIITAEKFLEGVEVNQNYPMLLLHLVHKKEVDMTIRIAGAIAFKNYIKRNWSVVSWSESVYFLVQVLVLTLSM